ncbi:WD40 repeat domain-containing protein [Lichenifustis flavocetrariae]|uniref:WD40 repeat domain-containing protein n=1 Tax=Lichenifustis flavocetrariae TaxID=2949735 RepID=A0AA42CHD4_9HYPH|nr:WD40 repeat domain-containing protein [Lichenifustis flavocetrariae]MCW6507159.1 WD40 repeat domain-containing protein [Lichenifustis flavocetrariae]
MALASATSLIDSVVPISAGAHVTAAAFLGATPVLALGDGAVFFAEDPGRRVEAHPDAGILVAATNGDLLLTGGDDGRVVATDAKGTLTVLGDEKGQWIDAVALRSDGAAAWSAGKTVRSRSAKGEVKTIAMASTARGLAFAPKGYRLAIAHYNGASLWFPNTAEAPDSLTWKGSHLDVTWSPDGRFLVTSMQENSMHGWRLADGGNMRMSGYPAKPRSFSWSRDGNWLATSGAEACVVWPFEGKTGPMGKQPRECGVRTAKITQVAFHPKAMVLAMGYDDGFVLMCRLSDASELPVRLERSEGGAVSALAWDDKGERLLFGTRGGDAGLIRLPT